MANLDLSKYGIVDVKEIVHNPSYDVLFAEETKPSLEGFEKGQVTELGAVNVMTGIYTGRSPKDKFFVKNEASEDSDWHACDKGTLLCRSAHDHYPSHDGRSAHQRKNAGA